MPMASNNSRIPKEKDLLGERRRCNVTMTSSPIKDAYALIRKIETVFGRSLERLWYATKNSGVVIANICQFII